MNKLDRDRVYYDFIKNQLYVLYWLGNRFYIETIFDNEVYMCGKSKPNVDPLKANLIYIGEM
jgi:hypothetical protein